MQLVRMGHISFASCSLDHISGGDAEHCLLNLKSSTNTAVVLHAPIIDLPKNQVQTDSTAALHAPYSGLRLGKEEERT